MGSAAAPTKTDPDLKYAWYVVAVLTVIYIFNFVDRQILALMVDPIKADLGISDTQMGLLMGIAFAVFYTFCGLPLGRVADRYSRRGLIAAGLLAWSAMTAICGLARNFVQLLLARMGVGVGEAALSPAAYSLITDYFPREKLATAISTYSMGIYLGSASAYLVGGVIRTYSDNWRLIFFILGVPGILLTLILMTVREPVRTHFQRKDAKLPPLRDVIRYLWQLRSVVLTHNFGFAFLSFSNYGAGAWLPTFFIRHHGIPAGETGILYGTIVMIFGTSGIYSGGRLADRLGVRGRANAKVAVGFMASLIGTVFSVGIILVPDVNWAWGMLAVALFFNSAPFGVAPAAIQEIMPATMRGQASAVYLFVVNLVGLGLGPTAVGLATDYLFADEARVGASLLLCMTVSHLLSAALLWVSARNYHLALRRLEEMRTA